MYQLFNDDCVNILKQLPDNALDMVITSPPYDNLRTYNNSSVWNFDIFKIIANELFRTMKDGGVLCWVVNDKMKNGNKTLTSFKQALYFQDIGFNFRDNLIWKKDTFSYVGGINTSYPDVYENVFIISKNKIKKFYPIKDRKCKYYGVKENYTMHTLPNGDKIKQKKNKTYVYPEYGIRFNVWDINAEKSKQNHPAVFPLSLPKDLIKSWSNEGDLILDPFMGSGTTGVACKELNRDFIGIEIDKQYFEIAKERIDNVSVV